MSDSMPVPPAPAPFVVVVYSAREYDRKFFLAEAARRPTSSPTPSRPLTLTFVDDTLTLETAAAAAGASVVVPFVNDVLSAPVLERLAALGVRGVALRCAGFDNVDKAAAARLGLAVLRVPAYSPTSVAEHAVTLLCALNRKVKKSVDRTRHGNFDLSGLVGRDLSTCTVGIVGTGRIGLCFARIMHGFGSRLLAYDVYHSPEAAALGVTYVGLDELLSASDVISLHCNLTPENTHMIDAKAFASMKQGAVLINTARGGLVDTRAAIDALKSGHLGALGIDVVEEESSVFFRYRDREVPDALARLILFNNVLITGHQAFLTEEALASIAAVTLSNVDAILDARDAGRPVAAGPTVVVAA